jgi:hypothetical protein
VGEGTGHGIKKKVQRGLQSVVTGVLKISLLLCGKMCTMQESVHVPRHMQTETMHPLLEITETCLMDAWDTVLPAERH